MKKTLAFLFFLLIIPVCYADDLWFYNSENLLLNVMLSTNLEVKSPSANPQIEFITANISFFPKKVPGQDILSSEFTPESKRDAETVIFEWKNPSKGNLSISMFSKVRVDNNPIRINGKSRFPMDSIPYEVSLYTKPAEIIDINDEIIETASEIASGKDDAVEVVDSIAVWVNTNINYSFDTFTAEASQKSSWVIDKREGVCDEITSLFISMLRSLGIPARFVAGISYTNSPLFTNKWGPHGWAEVYFPDYGWVPYDVTYGEYGWVDPTHIVSRISDDAGKITSTYQWKSESGVKLDLHDLDTQVDVINAGKKRGPDIRFMDISVLDGKVGFGSYNLITASIINLRDYYLSTDLYLAKTNRVKNVDDVKKHILLRPGEIKELTWIVQVEDDLDPEYIYSFPVEIFTLDNISASTTFNSVDNEDSLSMEEINHTLGEMQDGGEGAYSKNLDMLCSLDKDEYYLYEKPVVYCYLRNKGNIFFRDLRICLEDDCGKTNLGITQEKNLSFPVRRILQGNNDLALTADNDQISKTEHITFMGLDEPKITMTDFEFPSEVKYADNFEITFNLKKESNSDPYEVKVLLSGPGIDDKFSYSNLSENLQLKVDLKGRYLDEGANKLSIDLLYKDKNGKEHVDSEYVVISLVDVNLFQRILLFLRAFFR